MATLAAIALSAAHFAKRLIQNLPKHSSIVG
jgi:hypothetical protein